MGSERDALEDAITKIEAQRAILGDAAAELAISSLRAKLSALAPAAAARKVFLSYGHDPACEYLVHRLEGDLRRRGFEPWIDKERIRFGDDWRRQITDGIRESSHVLAFLSKHSMRTPGVCRQEISIALGPLKSHVYTVLVEPLSDVRPPLIVSRLQWLDMREWQRTAKEDPAAFEALYEKSLAEIIRVLEQNEPFAGEIDALQRWLDPIDSTSDMITHESGFTGREWLLGGIVESDGLTTNELTEAGPGEIERWRTSGSSNQVFWLAADPGWGKSAVAARLAHAGRSRVMAVHFCRHDQPRTRDARQVVRSLAFQMATQLEEYRLLLVDLARKHVGLVELNASELFQTLLVDPLIHVIAGDRGPHDRHLIVLDALDETLVEGRSELLTIIAAGFGKLPNWLGLVVTSRPETPVKRHCGVFGIHAMQADDPRNLRDIREYVVTWLDSQPLDESQRERALETVLKAGAGNFLYVQKLQEAVSNGAIAVAQLLDGSQLPSGLSSLYGVWFQHRFPQPTDYAERQRPFLELIIAAREPLPHDLARQLLKWDDYAWREIIQSLGSLCVEDAGTLRFFHKSLPEWLGQQAAAGPWWISEKSGQKRMADELLHVWKTAGSKSLAQSAFHAFGATGRDYALRHAPAHLRLAGRAEERVEMLTHFDFAMQRCAGGAVESFLEDYRAERQASRGTQIGGWARCVGLNSHLLRRGTPEWPADRILLQIATEHADDSAITSAAESWIQSGACDWLWMRRNHRPAVASEDSCLMVLEENSGSLGGARSMANGRILSWSGDGILRVWDGHSGLPIAELEGHAGGIVGADLLPNGKIISWSWDKTIRLWGGLGSEPAVVLEGHAEHYGHPQVKILPGGRILSWAEDFLRTDGAALSVIYVWDDRSGARLAVLEGHTAEVRGAQRLSDGRILSWSEDKTLRIWDGHSGATLSVLSKHASGVHDAVVIPGDRLLSLAGEEMLLWHATGGAPIAVMQADSPWIRGAAPLPHGRIVSWSTDGAIHLWDSNTGALLALLEGHSDDVFGVQPAPNGRILSWSFDGTLRLWDGNSGSLLAVLEGHMGRVMGAEFLPDGRILSWSEDKTLRIWDGQTGKPLAVLDGHAGAVEGAHLSPDGRILSWSEDNTIRLWDATIAASDVFDGARKSTTDRVSKPKKTHLLSWLAQARVAFGDLLDRVAPTNLNPQARRKPTLAVEEIAILPMTESGAVEDSLHTTVDLPDCVFKLSDGRILTYQVEDDSLQLCAPWGGVPVILEGHSGFVRGANMLPDGGFLVWFDDGYFPFDPTWAEICLWDRHSVSPRARLQGHTDRICDATALPDGRVLSCSWDKTVRVWDGLTGYPLSILEGHTAAVCGAQITPDGRILSWSSDTTLRVWDGHTGEALFVLLGHGGTVEGAHTMPDGKILSWSGDKTIRMWDSLTGKCLAVVNVETGVVQPEWHEFLCKIGVQRLCGSWWIQAIERRVSIVDIGSQEKARWHGSGLSSRATRFHHTDGGLIGVDEADKWGSPGPSFFLAIYRGRSRIKLKDS
jgi:WD40 repeat protein